MAVLPLLPNPARFNTSAAVLSASATEGLRALKALGDAATAGTTEYPYPPTNEYPLPPLPQIPLPTNAKRHRPAAPVVKEVKPDPDPALPPSSPLAGVSTIEQAIEVHNASNPLLPASLHYGATAVFVVLAEKGYIWAFVDGPERAGGEGEGEGAGAGAGGGRVLGVRFFPRRDRRPQIHTLPPPGPATSLSTALTSLNLSLPKLLYRLPALVGLLDEACYLCGRFLSDVDGGGVRTGYLRERRGGVSGRGSVSVGGSGGEDKSGKKATTGTAATAGTAGTATGDKKEVPKDLNIAEDKECEGRWVAWHPFCETP